MYKILPINSSIYLNNLTKSCWFFKGRLKYLGLFRDTFRDDLPLTNIQGQIGLGVP